MIALLDHTVRHFIHHWARIIFVIDPSVLFNCQEKICIPLLGSEFCFNPPDFCLLIFAAKKGYNNYVAAPCALKQNHCSIARLLHCSPTPLSQLLSWLLTVLTVPAQFFQELMPPVRHPS